jgi:hypothetical protein
LSALFTLLEQNAPEEIATLLVEACEAGIISLSAGGGLFDFASLHFRTAVQSTLLDVDAKTVVCSVFLRPHSVAPVNTLRFSHKLDDAFLFSRTRTRTHVHSLLRAFSRALSFILTLIPSRTPSLTHTHARTRTHIHTRTNTHTHTHSLTHSLTHT